MRTGIELIDLPELVGIDYRRILGGDGQYHSRPFVNFRWNGQDIWLIGKVVWHNVMPVGGVFLRSSADMTVHSTGITVQPRFKPPTFRIDTSFVRAGAETCVNAGVKTGHWAAQKSATLAI